MVGRGFSLSVSLHSTVFFFVADKGKCAICEESCGATTSDLRRKGGAMLRSSRALRSGLALHRLVAAARTAAPVSELSPLVSSLSVSVNETSAIAAISSAACKVFLSFFSVLLTSPFAVVL
jgi:hypothetical protein